MAVVANTWNDATNIRHVLFLAPTMSYAQAVVRNTRKDLDKEGIKYDSYAGVLEGDTFLNTEHLHVKFICSDPVLWNHNTFSGYSMVFGQKELLQTASEKFLRANIPIETKSIQSYIIDFEHGGRSKTTDKPKTTYLPEISRVHFNPPMTIVIWEDGTKTTVKCQDGDLYSEEVGLALCITKKALGNKGNFNDAFRKWIPEDRHVEVNSPAPTVALDFDRNEFLESTSTSLRNSLLESTKNAIKRALNITHEEA